MVCRITSKLYKSVYDVELKDWETNGLKLASVIRVHKIAALEKNMIDVKLGEIDSITKNQVINIIQALLRN